MQFAGIANYITPGGLKMAVNAAIVLEEPLHGALLKNEQRVMLFERLTVMARREGR